MVIVLAVLIVVGLTHTLVLRMLAWPLFAESSSTSADYYCLRGDELGMDGFEPLTAAANWYGKSDGGKILLLSPRSSRIVEIGAVRPFAQTCQSELRKRGLPPADVWPTRADAGDPWGTAHAMQDWLRAHPESTVTIACSPFSSGQLRYSLHKVLGQVDDKRVRLATLPDPGCRIENWWRSRRGVKEFMFAWLELVYLWAEGDHLRPDLPNAAEFQQEVRSSIGKAPP